MLFVHRVPKLLRWIFSVVFILLAVMTVSRLIIYWQFNPPGKAFSGSAFILGLRYDARIVSITGLAMMLLCALPFLDPFKNNKAAVFWNILLPAVFMLLVLVLAIDFYHFDYLHQRLNATVLNYLEDAGISVNMMWQSYPLLKISLGFILLLVLARLGFGKLLARYREQYSYYKRKGRLMYVIAFVIFGIFIFGRIGQFPLRWSDAYTLSDDFKANLALNPFQSFVSTLNFRSTSYDLKKVRAGYPLMAGYLGINNPDSSSLNFERVYAEGDTSGTRPNIVLVLCESFSAYKSSMYNNPLNTTPYFNELCKNGIFFDRCFTPAYGTARGV
jgi:cell shape-determining protein MreD